MGCLWRRRAVAVLALLLMAAGGTAGDCSSPPALRHGSLSDAHITKTSFSPNTRVRYVCDPGYLFKQGTPPFILCRADSTWSKLQAICILKSCGSPGELLNGYYKANSITFGSRANFYCNSGYKMVGRSYRVCGVSGWNGQVPTCDAVKCPDLPVTVNGFTPRGQGEFWEYGMIAEYRCKADYSLIGSRVRVCQANGHWDHKAPTCQIVRCESPAIPKYARIIGGFGQLFKFGEQITYRCNVGYVMIGQATIHCTVNDFKPSLPSCQSESEVVVSTAGPTPDKGGSVGTSVAPNSEAGRNVGQWYGLLIILVYLNT